MSLRIKNPALQLGQNKDSQAPENGGSPNMDRKKQFATVALAKTRNRRPSTVKLFANSSNPFQDAPGSRPDAEDAPKPALGPGRSQQRDDSGLNKKSAGNLGGDDDDSGGFDKGPADSMVGATPEASLVAQYRAREPSYRKDWSMQQPFRFGTAADVATANQSFPPRASDGRVNPQEWEALVASYNDWELGMLHKLALAAALLLTPDDQLNDPARLDARLDEIARGDSAVRAEPVVRPKSVDHTEEDRDSLSVTATPESARKRSPRSPDTHRKSQKYGSWSAKVAAAKKKSWERKKGADTLSQLRAEEGLSPTGGSEKSEQSDNSVFGIWNKDGSAAASPLPPSVTSTPTASPQTKRKDTSEVKRREAGAGTDNPPAPLSRTNTPVQMRKSNRFSSIRRRGSSNAKQLLQDASDEEVAAFPGLSLRTSDAKEFLELKKANEQKEKEAAGAASPGSPPNAAFPGLSLRSADAKEFQELLKADKQRKAGDGGVSGAASPSQTSPTGSVISPGGGNGSPPDDKGTPVRSAASPRSPPDELTSSPSGTPIPGRRQPPKTELGLKLSFLTAGRRSSHRGEPQAASSLSASTSSIPVDGGSKDGTPQKSPKNKRFSNVFARSKDTTSTTTSPRQAEPNLRTSGSLPSTPQSPRRTPTKAPRQTSPRTSQGLKVGSFVRRKTASPRTFEENRPTAASPPLSARELMADASTLAALDDLLGEDGVSPRPDASPRMNE